MNTDHTTPRVAIIMGSQSDWKHMVHAHDMLDTLDIAHESRVISAHRTPDRHHRYITEARARGISVVIAGAGMAAHLAGVTAALTDMPVIGVPLPGGVMDGLDSLLATVQMPGGMPVATMAVGKAGAKNAALFAAQILAVGDASVRAAVVRVREAQTAAVPEYPTDTVTT